MTTVSKRRNTIALGLFLGLTLLGAGEAWGQLLQIIRIDCGQVVVGQPATCRVDVRNVGLAPSLPTTVTLEATGPGQLIRATASLASVARMTYGQASALLTFLQAGSYTVRALIGSATGSTLVMVAPPAITLRPPPTVAEPQPEISVGGRPGPNLVDFTGRSTGPGVFASDLSLTRVAVPLCGGNTGPLAQVVVWQGSVATLFPGPSEIIWSWDGQVVKRTQVRAISPASIQPGGVSGSVSPSIVVQGSGGVLPPTSSTPSTPGSSSFPLVTDTLYDQDILSANIPSAQLSHGMHEIMVEVHPIPPFYPGQSELPTTTNPSTTSVTVDLCDFTVSLRFNESTYYAEMPPGIAVATVEITNHGPGTCCARETVPVDLSYQQIEVRHPQPIWSLGSGMSTTRTFSLPIWAYHQNAQGIVTAGWTAWVNRDGRIRETNHANNRAPAQYEVMYRIEERLPFGGRCDTRSGVTRLLLGGGGDHHEFYKNIRLQNRWTVKGYEFHPHCNHVGIYAEVEGFNVQVGFDTGIEARVAAEPVVGSDDPFIVIRVWTGSGSHRDPGYEGAVIIHGPRGLHSR